MKLQKYNHENIPTPKENTSYFYLGEEDSQLYLKKPDKTLKYPMSATSEDYDLSDVPAEEVELINILKNDDVTKYPAKVLFQYGNSATESTWTAYLNKAGWHHPVPNIKAFKLSDGQYFEFDPNTTPEKVQVTSKQKYVIAYYDNENNQRRILRRKFK
jgi:hypothetical protein